MDEYDEYRSLMRRKRRRRFWTWAACLVVISAAMGIIGYYLYLQYLEDKNNDATHGPAKTVTVQITPKKIVIDEDWVVDSEIVKRNKTSTDTHKVSDGLYRMYFMDQGAIYYADSKDGKTFGQVQSTGIRETSGKMISNPAVLPIKSGKWIMIYEMAPVRQPGEQMGPPGPANQRNLYRATSTDGKSFKAAGLAIDSSKEDNYFASVPDLVPTPDGKIRMYYVSGGEAIGSAISSDKGRTWRREEGYRLKDMAVDPDVTIHIYGKEIKWAMYYSILEPSKNAIYKAISTDGLTWTHETKLFEATTGGAIVDPDVIEITPNNYAMFFGQSTGGGSTGGEEINLYRAELKKSIFEGM